MAKIFTNGKDQFAGGFLYKPDKDGYVNVPDDIAAEDGLINKKTSKDKPKEFTKNA